MPHYREKKILEMERRILGGHTVEEQLRRMGGRFWLDLSDDQTEALKALYRDHDIGRVPPGG